MKFGQVIEYNKTKFFLQKSSRRWGMEPGSRYLKEVVCNLVSKCFNSIFQYIYIGIQ